jgi:hypothetical protein
MLPSDERPFALLIGWLAYEREGGLELAYRFARFGQWDCEVCPPPVEPG